jgi:hypothetical protein
MIARAAPPLRPPAKACSTFELGQEAGERLKSAFEGRRDIATRAIEWYRGFSRGLGGEPLLEVERFIIQQCHQQESARRQLRSELAILDVLATSPLDLLPMKRRKTRNLPYR